jgi:hypothetical protein
MVSTVTRVDHALFHVEHQDLFPPDLLTAGRSALLKRVD